MKIALTLSQLHELGLADEAANQFLNELDLLTLHCPTSELAWQTISTKLLPRYSFNLHLLLFTSLFPNWHSHPETAPAWLPSPALIETANITQWMKDLDLPDVKDFHEWTTENLSPFWGKVVEELDIVFETKPNQICDLSKGVESPHWFPDTRMNITASCFNADPAQTAILYQDHHETIHKITYDDLLKLVNQIANSLIKKGFAAGDTIAIAMPMSQYAIAIYLGIIKMGGIVVSIADSFSSEEIATRLAIAKVKGIFTQDIIMWGGKQLPLYEKVQLACRTLSTPILITTIVLPCESALSVSLHENDLGWDDFLVDNADFTPLMLDPMSPCNILFSSGTTGAPKAIIWNHTTPIKAASDAFFHQNIQPADVLAWPTNLGWMMGPWLVFAALINHATIAVFSGAPKDRAFGEFIQNTKVTMLGVVPTLVATWRQSKCMEQLNWESIKTFSSTGECSNPEDMLYLMSLANYKPIIEYCGGTEIGGAYISSTVVENNYPSLFSTPTMGLNIILLDEHGQQSTTGEVAIIPPSIGLSTALLNDNHYQIYFKGMPLSPAGGTLRRHGDQLKQYPNGYYSILGRVDDTMNLSGIKISAAEIERAIAGVENIIEVAAIAIPPVNNGPNLLVIYAAATKILDKESIMKEMQKKINVELNPLFRIYDIIFTNDLPKTASNKIMRRVLRKQYMTLQSG